MFSIRAIVSFLAVATALTGVLAAPTEINNCNVEQEYCCDQTYYSDDKNFLDFAGLVGILVPVERTMVGVQCNPIANIVGGVKGCQASAVCCSENNFNGLVNVGCNSIQL
ncbi:fungal hydrophobin [Serendipita vermifera]|nr:fungal hydrophobin [Serendipita vermifera]